MGGKNEVSCKICDINFYNGYVLQRHIERVHAKTYKCFKCKTIFHGRSALRQHIKNVHQTIECSKCFRKFASQGGLNHHFQQYHDGKVNVSMFFCKPCNIQFIDKSSHDYHIQQQHTKPSSIDLKNHAIERTHLDYTKILNSDMAPEKLLSDNYYDELLSFLQDQQATLKNFKFAFALIAVYEAPVNSGKETYRQGKFIIVYSYFQLFLININLTFFALQFSILSI